MVIFLNTGNEQREKDSKAVLSEHDRDVRSCRQTLHFCNFRKHQRYDHVKSQKCAVCNLSDPFLHSAHLQIRLSLLMYCQQRCMQIFIN